MGNNKNLLIGRLFHYEKAGEGQWQRMSANGETLRQALTSFFDEEELRTLCYDLGVDYDNLPGDGKAAKARELVGYHDRRGTTNQLIAAYYMRRPRQSWQAPEIRSILPQSRATNRMLMMQVGRLEIGLERLAACVNKLRTLIAAAITAEVLLLVLVIILIIRVL